jgi:hypothetical protein
VTALTILVALASLGVGLFALWTARGVGRRLRLMNQSHWELRYEHSRLKARVDRLAPEAADEGDAPRRPAPPAPAGEVAFVPLASVKRRDPGGD